MTDNQFKVSHPKTLKGNSTHTLPPPPLPSPTTGIYLFLRLLISLIFMGYPVRLLCFMFFVDLTVHNVQQHS